MITHKDLGSSARMANHFPSGPVPYGIYSERLVSIQIHRSPKRGQK
ncbi:hypothetical protein LEP1GSC195_2576 [Leptospira wolbachii serovar Codice str. CDC]|uniref:Uncharacterized protein n=1 Tax=Leptospira wolbachii serovar Codice str. CDC TaxID=1218599 RepID=R9A197_9LEPT|nr:hypothetical protein [Leptospira wolbachii]EOQ95887.1 hypothetical protein LEP1GSC195_2576 [Leptospira wolbachii serovar Codice str. CDC]